MKRKILLGVVVGALSLGLVGCQSNNKSVKEAYENLLNKEKKYEYVKTVYSDGSYVEEYRDIQNRTERDDHYTKDNKLESRDISNGREIIALFKDENGKWTGYKEGLADSIIKDNEKRNSTSLIDYAYKKNISSIIDNDYVSKEKVDGLIRYSDDKNNFVYVDPNTNMISKVKFSQEKDNMIEYEFKFFDNISKRDLSINASNKENIDLSKIKIEDRGKQEGMEGPGLG